MNAVLFAVGALLFGWLTTVVYVRIRKNRMARALRREEHVNAIGHVCRRILFDISILDTAPSSEMRLDVQNELDDLVSSLQVGISQVPNLPPETIQFADHVTRFLRSHVVSGEWAGLRECVTPLELLSWIIEVSSSPMRPGHVVAMRGALAWMTASQNVGHA
ncbi:MAG: hypothetical protein FWD69_17940 [Polyangiaceae bacterium]|nr:hypothetical protein [Polyangiaceae bacterium]